MKQLVQVIFVLSLVSFSSALECYRCSVIGNSTTHDCIANPKKVDKEECKHDGHGHKTGTSASVVPTRQSTMADLADACYKANGTVLVRNGTRQNFLFRGCFSDIDKADSKKCVGSGKYFFDWNDNGTTYNVTANQLCFCTGKRCNSGQLLHPSYLLSGIFGVMVTAFMYAN